MGVRLPTSSQWDMVEQTADALYPVYKELIKEAANGNVIHNDDTKVRILSTTKEAEEEEKKGGKNRKATHTTGLVSLTDKYPIMLFFSGKKHAGENLEELLKKRAAELQSPIQMSDALSCNYPKDYETIVCNCIAHARRKFYELHTLFPEEVKLILKMFGEVYENDFYCKSKNMSDEERLNYHQKNSTPIMNTLQSWCEEQFEKKKVEPNSALGEAIKYLNNHWEKLIRFLEVPGAPIDNNICERLLKKAVLHRKNSLFYKTEIGAKVGDILMSVVETCDNIDVNAFHYLVEIQNHKKEVFKNPSNWLPWNYQQSHQEHSLKT